MSFGADLSETFSQINAAGSASIRDVDVSISNGGNIIGQGISGTSQALNISGGNLNRIISAFGGSVDAIEGGGVNSLKHKAGAAIKHARKGGEKMQEHLETTLKKLQSEAADLEAFAALAKSALKEPCDKSIHEVLGKLVHYIENSAESLRSHLDKELKLPKQKIEQFLQRNKQFAQAIETLGARISEPNAAGMVSLVFSNVNELSKIGKDVEHALKTVGLKKDEFLGSSLASLDQEIHRAFDEGASSMNVADKQSFIEAWCMLLANHGHAGKLKDFVHGAGPGSEANSLTKRLQDSRNQLRSIIDKFLNTFGANLNDIVSATNELATHLGKDVQYNDDVVQFIDSFMRLNEYFSKNQRKFYQHMLEINYDQIDSKEIKDRFLSNLRVLSEKAAAMGSNSAIRKFTTGCASATENIHKYSDMVKTFQEDVKKIGGSTDSMNELFSADASKIEISAMVNPLENLRIAVNKLMFFKNIAIFRSNLAQTNKELTTYSRDYEKSVGKAIGEMITRINAEYSEIMRQIDDNKTGMGLEIDMYNEGRVAGNKISKEKLKMMYKWQCEARIGLYKTVEAIDLYLLHFTDAITKNPDAVADLHKLLSATRIIAKWYDKKAGQNLIRVFESFKEGINEEALESERFFSGDAGSYESVDYGLADLEKKLDNERAVRVYERCRRAMQGVVVLKNILSYFMTLGEKYGDMRKEKSIFMAPSNIYKNLMNYLWVSAIDINTVGNEVMTDNNETKRLLTFEDTKVAIAKINDVDPETMGINFNKHSIDKLRILKTHNELTHLRDTLASLSEFDMARVKNFVYSTFARLGKTKYIFPMFLFGIYDFSQMDKPLLKGFEQWLIKTVDNEVVQAARNNINSVPFLVKTNDQGAVQLPVIVFRSNGDLNNIIVQMVNGRFVSGTNQDLSFADAISALTKEQQENVSVSIDYGKDTHRNMAFVSLKAFMALPKDFWQDDKFVALNGLQNYTMANDIQNRVRTTSRRFLENEGFMKGFLHGLTSSSKASGSILYSERILSVLHYCVMEMLNEYRRTQSSSVFAIDDNYFVLSVKAIAGKIMTVAGVNSLFKKPNDFKSMIVQNKTRLIMGGADSILGNAEVINEAVELYVRLPLLIEWYRSIFDNANKPYKQEDLPGVQPLDEERISFVPEIGNVWSGLIKNIFDSSKYIENGIYTQDNIRKIVSEVNTIYKHYKGKVDNDALVRHIMLELIAEINRRYGVIKRQELLNYYTVLNAAKTNRMTVTESNYTNNDFDILNEEVEFEGKSPSDAFIDLKKTMQSPVVDAETKINKLTDYKILKEFRERVQNSFDVNVNEFKNGADFISMVDRIRMLKSAISAKQSAEDKYDMIIKAIEDAEAMNQSSADIFLCFHEMVLVPLRTTYAMYHSINQFILALSFIAKCYPTVISHETLKIKVLGGNQELQEAIRAEIEAQKGLLFDNNDLFLYDTNLSLNGANDQSKASALINILSHFCHNSGNLVKVSLSTTGRITIDLSEFQTTCEYLVSNTKYMIDKFTGLVPTKLIEKVSNSETYGSIYWVEKALVQDIFNKLNKRESQRATICVDNLNKIMPLISDAIVAESNNINQVSSKFIISDINRPAVADIANCLSVLKDTINTKYKADTKEVSQISNSTIKVSTQLFNPLNTSKINDNLNIGLVQEFNTIVAHYLNDMYDSQARKIYTKSFSRFANNTFQDALNGAAFPDFNSVDVAATNFIPKNCSILSSTLAAAMKILSNRIHRLSGVKIFELGSISEVSVHTLERYRSCLPMYLRVFGIFVEKCKLTRRMLSKMRFAEGQTYANDAQSVMDTKYADIDGMTEGTRFATIAVETINGVASADVRDKFILFLDEVINGMNALTEDARDVHKELRSMDSSVPLFFDTKQNFTKSFNAANGTMPFAPLSTLTAVFSSNNLDMMVPIDHNQFTINGKFAYGMQSLLISGFDLSISKLPYMRELLNNFNGYNVKMNNITDDKFNSMLKNVGKAMGFFYDWRVYNGQVVATFPNFRYQTNPSELKTFQEVSARDPIITLIESSVPLDSKLKLAEHVKSKVAITLDPLLPNRPVNSNPRAKAIIVNILDLNVVPINVHSLMREMPLVNIYNYAMTFDQFVGDLRLNDQQKNLLLKPYSNLTMTKAELGADNNSHLRFISDVVFGMMNKGNDLNQIDLRMKSKLVRNLTFLTMVQYAIKQRVKEELDFINSRVVSDVSTVSNVITSATDDVNGLDENMFEF